MSQDGANLICHKSKPRDLRIMKMQVPYGEAEGGAVIIEISYSIAAKEHKGSGLLIVWLQSATDWR